MQRRLPEFIFFPNATNEKMKSRVKYVFFLKLQPCVEGPLGASALPRLGSRPPTEVDSAQTHRRTYETLPRLTRVRLFLCQWSSQQIQPWQIRPSGSCTACCWFGELKDVIQRRSNYRIQRKLGRFLNKYTDEHRGKKNPVDDSIPGLYQLSIKTKLVQSWFWG